MRDKLVFQYDCPLVSGTPLFSHFVFVNYANVLGTDLE